MSKENRSSHAAKRGPMGHRGPGAPTEKAVSYTHLRAHET